MSKSEREKLSIIELSEKKDDKKEKTNLLSEEKEKIIETDKTQESRKVRAIPEEKEDEDDEDFPRDEKEERRTTVINIIFIIVSFFTFGVIYKEVMDMELQIEIGLFTESLGPGDSHKLIAALTNLLKKSDEFRLVLYTGPKQNDEYPIDKKIRRVIAFDPLNNINMGVVQGSIKGHHFLIYAGDKPNTIELLSQTRKFLVLLNSHFYEELLNPSGHLYYNQLRKANLLVNFVPDELSLFNLAGFNKAIYIPKPSLYDTDYMFGPSLNSKNILTFDDYSGVERGIRALELIVKKYPKTKLNVIKNMNDENQKKILELAAQLNLANNVKFYPQTTKMDTFYKSASVVFALSDYESSPYWLLEAKAYSIPNIILGKNYMDLNKKGSINQVKNINDIANEVIKLFSNRYYRNIQGKEARKSLKNFSNSKLLKYWIRVLRGFSKGGIFADSIKKEQYNYLIAAQSEALMKNQFLSYKETNNQLKCLTFDNVINLFRGQPLTLC